MRRLSFPFALVILLPCETPLSAGDAKAPRRPGQYKRIHQRAFKKILAGEAERAVEDLRAFVARYGDDAESYYMLTVAHARRGRIEDAVASMERALALGLPPGRFIGGTLAGLEALATTQVYRRLVGAEAHHPVHGPMLGCARAHGVRIWLRTAKEAEVQILASRSRDLADPIRSPVVRTRRARDFTALVPLEGLEPSTTYFYAARVGEGPPPAPTDIHAFRTPPPRGAKAKLRVAFGGGAGYVPFHERMWDTIRSFRPAALLLLGDNVYIDDPKTPPMQHYTYYRRQSRPEFRRLVARTPVYAIWDDHDFGTNDCVPGPDIENPPWKRRVFEVFRTNWVNPSYGGGDAHPGCWFDFHLADVHFILLDGRYYRTLGRRGEGPSSMLGPVQKRWLLRTLRASRGTFKVLCSPVPWTFHAKGTSRDTWNGFREERGEIFDFLAEKGIDGVVLLSADRHRSDLWRIERDRGYALHEFSSSRLTNQHVHGTMERALFSYNRKQSFGLLEFDTTRPDPIVTYRIVTIDGEVVHTFRLERSQLTGGAR